MNRRQRFGLMAAVAATCLMVTTGMAHGQVINPAQSTQAGRPTAPMPPGLGYGGLRQIQYSAPIKVRQEAKPGWNRFEIRDPSVRQAGNEVRQVANEEILRIAQDDSDKDVELDDILDGLEPKKPTENLDDLLEKAKDLIENKPAPPKEPPATDELDDNLSDSLDKMLRDARENGAEEDELRDKLRQELDRILPEDDEDSDPLEDDEEEDDEETQARQEYLNSYVEPVPQPIYGRRTRRRNQPATLGNIFNDEDEVDPACEREFCRRMWACAGGKCQSWQDRLLREWRRDQAVRNAGCCGLPCSPMAGFKCPQKQQNTPCQPLLASSEAPTGGCPDAPAVDSFDGFGGGGGGQMLPDSYSADDFVTAPDDAPQAVMESLPLQDAPIELAPIAEPTLAE